MSKDTSRFDSKKFDPKMLEFLVCPLTKTALTYDADANELISIAAQKAFPIQDGVPLMTLAEARPLKALN